MIQLPSKIRTTLFNATVELEPFELFSQENDRLFVEISASWSSFTTPALGRSKQDVLNSDGYNYMGYRPIVIYGPEPIWMGLANISKSYGIGLVLVHGIYRA